MLQRDISTEAIEMLSGMLVHMAQHEVLRERWEKGPMYRWEVIQIYYHPAPGKDAAVKLISEPDFVLHFRIVGNTHVVEFEIHDRIIRHSWSRAILEQTANTMVRREDERAEADDE